MSKTPVDITWYFNDVAVDPEISDNINITVTSINEETRSEMTINDIQVICNINSVLLLMFSR